MGQSPHGIPVSRELDGPASEPLRGEEISPVFDGLRAHITTARLDLFRVYAERLLQENRRANLTSKRDGDRKAIYERHFAESLALLEALEDAGVLTSPVIDIGSGAGFPGVPMKIARPELDVTLVEATGKKVRFLESMATELGLDIRVIQGRAEDLGREPQYRDAYPLVVARAVAPLPVLLELALPFAKTGGVLAAPKGSAAPREIAESDHALAELGGEIISAKPLELPTDGPRPTLVLVRKTGATADRYPRRAGIPNKRPL